jgi:aldose 1-epimerase
MEEGYPGKVEISSSYIITKDNELYMTMTAKLAEGQPADTQTPINLINHTYWNLSGDFADGSIRKHKLKLPNSPQYLPLSDDLIPLGDPALVKRTPFDFYSGFGEIEAKKRLDGSVSNYGIPGIDHPYLVEGTDANNLAPERVQLAAVLEAGDTNMKVYSTQPVVYVYTGN